MKMKKITYITSAATLVLFALSGCNLDRAPLDTLAEQNYFNSREELETFTNGFYPLFPSAPAIFGETSDVVITTDLTAEVLGTRSVPSNGGGWSWNALSNINTYLTSSHKCTDEVARRENDGVARFFRAYFYFEKVKRFGEVPWYSAPLSSTDDKLYDPRTPRETLMQNILEDIDYAIENLPEKKDTYKLTKWTALALKSRIFLFEGTFRKYHGLGDHQKYLQESAEAAKQFIDQAPYSISKRGNQPYRDLFSSDNAIGDEVILARNYNLSLSVVHSVNQYFMEGGVRPGLNKKIVNSYLTKDGKRFTDIEGYQELGFYAEMQNRDPRLAQTIITPGYTRIKQNTPQSPSPYATCTGYQITKWVTDAGQDSYNKSHNDIILLRAAEVYLNYAEAKAELGTLTQADLDATVLKIRERVGMPGINLAQANANPDPYLSSRETGYPNVSGPNKGVILEIRRERTIELICEGFRYYDLVRWKEGKALEQQFKGVYFSAIDKEKGFTVYDMNGNGVYDRLDMCIYTTDKEPSKSEYPELKNVEVFLKLDDSVIQLENGADGGNIILHNINTTPRKWREDRDYLYPIPQSQITLYGGKLEQNPNW